MPVVLVLAVGDVVALDPLAERERPVPTALVLASGPSVVSLSRMFRTSKKSKTAGHGCSALRDDGVFVGLRPGGLGRHEAGDDARRELEVQDAVEVVDDVVAGHLAPGVELHALAQVELDAAWRRLLCSQLSASAAAA